MTVNTMTPAERAIAAFEHRIPDECTTFELEFQLAPEMFGRELLNFDYWRKADAFSAMSRLEKEKFIDDEADFYVQVYKTLEYGIIPFYTPWPLDSWETEFFIRCLRDRVGNTQLLGAHGDGTFAIPDGDHMYDFAYRLYEDREGLLSEADGYCRGAIEHNHMLKDKGIDVVWLCSDYCYNSGPFMSPEMFSVFITPFLERIVSAAKKDGLWVIKHTDGNIMPIIDQLVNCRPHALHSLDPMAGVDIAEVKRLYGDRIALCGNVNCALMQTGTDEQVRESALYALKNGMPGGGYFFCTSNIPFRGMPPERYQMILDIWKENRKY